MRSASGNPAFWEPGSPGTWPRQGPLQGSGSCVMAGALDLLLLPSRCGKGEVSLGRCPPAAGPPAFLILQGGARLTGRPASPGQRRAGVLLYAGQERGAVVPCAPAGWVGRPPPYRGWVGTPGRGSPVSALGPSTRRCTMVGRPSTGTRGSDSLVARGCRSTSGPSTPSL